MTQTRNQRSRHSYAIRPTIGGRPVLTATVDRQAKTITLATPAGETLTVNVTTARAIAMVLHAAVYERRSLDSAGPGLCVEVDRGTGAMRRINHAHLP